MQFAERSLKPMLKYKTKTDFLNKTLGGKWTFCGPFSGRWECDDGRVVRYTAPMLDEWDEPVGPPQCWLQTPNGSVVPFRWNMRAVPPLKFKQVIDDSLSIQTTKEV